MMSRGLLTRACIVEFLSLMLNVVYWAPFRSTSCDCKFIRNDDIDFVDMASASDTINQSHI